MDFPRDWVFMMESLLLEAIRREALSGPQLRV
jgi:hypothetical protein